MESTTEDRECRYIDMDNILLFKYSHINTKTNIGLPIIFYLAVLVLKDIKVSTSKELESRIIKN